MVGQVGKLLDWLGMFGQASKGLDSFKKAWIGFYRIRFDLICFGNVQIGLYVFGKIWMFLDRVAQVCKGLDGLGQFNQAFG